MTHKSLSRHIHFLILLSIGIWLILALNLTSLSYSRLIFHRIPWSGALLGLGYFLWLFLGVFLWTRIRKKIQTSNNPVPAACLFWSVFLFFLIIILMFLWVFHFNFKTYLISFLIVHFFGPLGILLARLSFLNSWENWNVTLSGIFAQRAFGRVKNMLLVLFSVMIFLIVIEGFFWALTGLEPEDARQYGTRPDLVLSPYLMFAEPDTTQGGDLNSQGFYGPELPLQKDPAEKRIALVGGSTVYAGKNFNSIGSILEDILKKRYPQYKIKVLNFGRMSYISMQELILLERNILPLNVDLIIVFDGFNDIWGPYNFNTPAGYPSRYSSLKKMTEISLTEVALNNFTEGIKSHSVLVSYLSKKLSKLKRSKEQKSTFKIKPVLLEYERNLFQMEVLAKAYSAKILFATQPFVGTKLYPTFEESKLLDRNTEKEIELYYQKLISSARETAIKGGAAYVDTTDVFDHIPGTVFSDPIHFHLLGGNPIVANKLANEIQKFDLIQ